VADDSFSIEREPPQTIQSTVESLARLAVETIEPAEACSITIAGSNGIETLVATSEAATKLDAIQRAVGEGPCISALREHRTFVIDDMTRDETWPRFSRKAAKAVGVNSVVAYVLAADERVVAALNLVATNKGVFSQQDVESGALFAAHAAVVLENVRGHEELKVQVDQLQQGMRTRQTIGQAVGIIMATRHCNAEEAFDTLKTISQQTNTKLRDIAQDLVEKVTNLDPDG